MSKALEEKMLIPIKKMFYNNRWDLEGLLRHKVETLEFVTNYKGLEIHCRHYLLRFGEHHYVIEGLVEFKNEKGVVENNEGRYMFNAPYYTTCDKLKDVNFRYLEE